MMPIADLHCDLLSYLCHRPGRSPHDAASRCSFTQLQEGGVALQTLAIWAETTPHSVETGKSQVDQFLSLTSPVQLIAAFENASAFASEEEPLRSALTRLEQYQTELKSILYISLTWNGENRFGGGVGTPTGLKPDGKHLLEWMSGKRIAVDLSHASDRLAEEIFNEIDAKSHQIPVLASHSNFRTITPHLRNLPDFLAKEIIQRKGLIGINLVAPFLHTTDPSILWRHIEYGLHLGAQDSLSFGADFFCDTDFPDLLQKHNAPFVFLPEYADASCFPKILKNLSPQIETPILQNISHLNVLRFLKTNII